MYRATIGGAFGGGAGPATAHPIDAGSIIDAITNGASSLIQNAYMRKQAEAGQADKQAQRAQEEKRYTDTITRDEQRYNQQRADKAADIERQGVKDEYQREFDARKLESENLKAGITPGRTTITREPEATAPTPSIAQSFQSADLSAGGPATPSSLTTHPSLGTIPRLNISSTPDQFTPKPTAQQHVVDPVTGEVKFFDPTHPPQGFRINPVPRPDTHTAVREQRMFQREQSLADDYNKDTKETREMAQRVVGAIAEAPAAKAGDGVAQVNLLYAFVSSMDPGTAVREGEIGLVRSAGSLVQQAQGFLAKYTKGDAVTVPPAMIDQMSALMQRRLDGSAKYVKNRSEYYKGRAKQWGVTEAAFPELDIPGRPAAPGAPGNVDLRTDAVMSKYINLTPRTP